MNVKVLRINSCKDGMKWYRNMIGSIVPLLDIEQNEYKSREPAGYINFVSLEDGTVEDCDEPHVKYYGE